MGQKFLLARTPIVSSHLHLHGDGELTIERQQDVQAIVDINKALYADAGERETRGAMSLEARIPMVVLMDLEKKGILGDNKRFKRWLNDPDNRFFRTKPGKI